MGILTGAIIGGVIGMVVVGIYWILASQAKPSFDVKLQRSGAFAAPMPPAAVIARLRDGAAAQKLEVALLDEANGRIILSEPVTVWSFGSFIHVTAEPAGGDAKVTVGLKTKAPQWGPVLGKIHKKVADKVKAILGLAA